MKKDEKRLIGMAVLADIVLNQGQTLSKIACCYAEGMKNETE